MQPAAVVFQVFKRLREEQERKVEELQKHSSDTLVKIERSKPCSKDQNGCSADLTLTSRDAEHEGDAESSNSS